MWLPWQQGKVYLSYLGFQTLPIYFQEKSQSWKKKPFAVSELYFKSHKGGDPPPPPPPVLTGSSDG